MKASFIALLVGLLISLVMILAVNEYARFQYERNGSLPQPRAVLDDSLRPSLHPSSIWDDMPLVLRRDKPDRPHVDGEKELKKTDLAPRVEQYERKFKDTGDVIYSVTVRKDDAGRRIVERRPHPKNEVALVVLGCSLTFGEGLEDFESIPSKLSTRLPKLNVYNMGRPGSSESEIYHDMTRDKRDFFLKIPEKKIILINTFFDDHLIRQACGIDCYRKDFWVLWKPRFILNPQNELEFKGFFNDFYHPNFLTNLIVDSSFFKYFGLPRNATSDNNFNLLLKIMQQIRTEYAKEHQILDFYNYFHHYSSEGVTNRLAPKSQAAGFKPIILHKEVLYSRYSLGGLRVIDDGHPSALANEANARAIAWYLERDYPELTKKK